MKKILFVLPTLHCGGAERVTITLAKSLPAEEFDVKFINIGDRRGELLEMIQKQFPLVSWGYSRTLYSIWKLYKFLKSEKTDYVYSSRIHVSILLLIINYLLPKFKVILRIPTMPSNKLYSGIKALLIDRLERLLYRKAYKIIAQTDEMRSEIIQRYKVIPSKVVTILNPIDKDWITLKLKNQTTPYPLGKGRNYLAVGNIVYAKAYDILIKAFQEFLKTEPEASLYILGRKEGKYAEGILKLIDVDNLKEHIHFMGFCQNPYVYMKYCDAFVLSSRMEGLPNVLLEALYLGKPVIATMCVPIVKQLITDGVNGCKVEIENVGQLVEALERIVNIKDLKGYDPEPLVLFSKILK